MLPLLAHMFTYKSGQRAIEKVLPLPWQVFLVSQPPFGVQVSPTRVGRFTLKGTSHCTPSCTTLVALLLQRPRQRLSSTSSFVVALSTRSTVVEGTYASAINHSLSVHWELPHQNRNFSGRLFTFSSRITLRL